MHTRYYFWTWQNPWWRYKLHKHLAALALGKVGQRQLLHQWLQHHPLDLVQLLLVRLLRPSVEAQEPPHHLQLHRPRDHCLLVPLLPLPLLSLDHLHLVQLNLVQLQLEMGEACRPLRQRDKCLGQSQRAASVPETGQRMLTAYNKTVSFI